MGNDGEHGKANGVEVKTVEVSEHENVDGFSNKCALDQTTLHEDLPGSFLSSEFAVVKI